MQVENIAEMFNLDSRRPVWIVRAADNTAIWPKGGKFTGPLLVHGHQFEVKGHVPLVSPTSLPDTGTSPCVRDGKKKIVYVKKRVSFSAAHRLFRYAAVMSYTH